MTLHLGVVDRASANQALQHLLEAWRCGMNGPLPLAARSALACAGGGDAETMYDGNYDREGESADPYLARCFPDFEALCADGRFDALAETIYRPMLDWIAASVRVLPRERDAATNAEEAADV